MPRGSKPGERRGGRKPGVPNKITLEIKDLALRHGPMALAEAARLVKKAKTDGARLAAIGIILDRAYGRATQYVQHGGALGSYDVAKLAGLSIEELRAFEATLARIASDAAPPLGDPGGDREA